MAAITFMAGFAAAWWIAAFLGSQHFVGLAAVGPAVSAVMILAARVRLKGGPIASAVERKRRGQIIGWSAGLEGLAIFVAVGLLNRFGLSAYAFPAAAVVVGLHFLPLAALLPLRVYYLSALSLVSAGIIGLYVQVADRPFVVGTLSAIVLWATCLERLAKASSKKAS